MGVSWISGLQRVEGVLGVCVSGTWSFNMDAHTSPSIVEAPIVLIR